MRKHCGLATLALVTVACTHVTLYVASDSESAGDAGDSRDSVDAGCVIAAFEASFEASYGDVEAVVDTGWEPSLCAGCVEIAAGSNPQSIALDATHVYWTEGSGDPWLGSPPVSSTDLVLQMARGGTGGIPIAVASALAGPFILKQAGSWLAWSNVDGFGSGKSSIDTLALGKTGAPYVPGPGLFNAHGVALDATNVYWVSSDMGAIDAVVQSAPLAGGAITTLGTTATGGGLLPMGMAVNATSIYFVAYQPSARTGGLYELPITGGIPIAIWTSPAPPSEPTDVAVDGVNVYWVDYGSGSAPDGAVYAMSLAGGTVTTMAAALYGPLTIALDSENVYFAGNGGVYEEAIGSTSPVELVNEYGTVGVAADDDDGFVYFTTDDMILAHPK